MTAKELQAKIDELNKQYQSQEYNQKIENELYQLNEQLAHIKLNEWTVELVKFMEGDTK